MSDTLTGGWAADKLTVLDYFAGQAMTALIEGYDFEAREKSVIKTDRTGFDDNPHVDSDATFASQLAEEAYIIAAAMMVARQHAVNKTTPANDPSHV